jgi:hypothetical protein
VGPKVAYTTSVGFGFGMHFHIARFATGAVTRFGEATGLQSTRAGSWSPDGQHLLFSDRAGEDLEFPWRIYTANADGSNVVRISGPADETTPRSGPKRHHDRLYVVGVGDPSPNLKPINADGRNERLLSASAPEAFGSQDSSKLAITGYDNVVTNGHRFKMRFVSAEDGSLV